MLKFFDILESLPGLNYIFKIGVVRHAKKNKKLDITIYNNI